MTQKDTPETVSLPFGAMVLAGAVGGGLGLGGCLTHPSNSDAIHREWGTGGQWWVCVGQHGAHVRVARPLEHWMAIWPGALLSRLLATGIMAWLLYFRPLRGMTGSAPRWWFPCRVGLS